MVFPNLPSSAANLDFTNITGYKNIEAKNKEGLLVVEESFDGGIVGENDYSTDDPTNKLIYAQRQYVDNQFGKLISLTETQILAISSPEVGRLYYNTTQNHVVFYDGTGWKKLTHTNM
jgi:hypothetical protein